MKRREWTDRELRILRDLYPDVLAETVARELGRSVSSVHQKAGLLGLRKSDDFNARDLSGRIQRGTRDPRMVETRFKRGAEPWNKGIAGSTGTQAGCRATQFQKGRPANESRNYVPIGTLRLSKDGYMERKVTDDPSIYPARRWVAVHRIVWEAEHGPIPAGHAVVFRPGMKTTDVECITTSILEMVTRAQLMRRNSVHTVYPPEVARLVQLRGALNRQINARTRAMEQQ